jgi:hypothetical protein
VVLDLDNVLVINKFDTRFLRKLFEGRMLKMLFFVYELAEFLLGLIRVPKLETTRTAHKLITKKILHDFYRRENSLELILLTDRSLLGLFNVVKRNFSLNAFEIVYVRKSFFNRFFLKKPERLGLNKNQQIWQHREIKPHASMIDAIFIHAKNLGIKPEQIKRQIIFVDDLPLMRNIARQRGFRTYAPGDLSYIIIFN